MMRHAARLNLLLLALLPTMAAAQGTRLWTQSRFDDFEKGTPKGVAIRSDGHLEAGPDATAVLTTPSTYVWSVASDASGNAYLATGSPATLLKVTPDGKSTTLFETKDLSVQVVRTSADGAVYAATLPRGRVYRLKAGQTGMTDDTAQVIFDPEKTDEKPKYIWDMTFDASGRLYIAAGGPAAVYRWNPAKPDATAELFFKSDEQHIRSIAFNAKGELIAGTDGSGLVYRIDQSGKGFVLFESPRREITSVAIGEAGTIYAVTVGDKSKSTLPPLPVQGIVSVTTTITILQPGSIQSFNASTVVPDGSEIYELKDGAAPRKLWANRDEVVYALRPTPQGLLAAAGNHGHVFRIAEAGEYADIAHLEASQAVAFADAPKGLFIATSNTGKLYRMSLDPASEGTYTSTVFDASVFTQWGRPEVSEIVESKAGGFELFARSGNLENPERGWSDWKKVTPNQSGAGGAVGVPAARYIQWKAVLHAGGSIGAVGLNYLPVNVAPEVDEIVVVTGARVTTQPPAPQAGQVMVSFPAPQTNVNTFIQEPTSNPLPAAKDRTAITARWNAHDDNGDELTFDVYYRGDDEREWRLLKKKVTERYYSFDSSLLPDGGYRLRVVASDAPSHNPGEALTGEHVSERFMVDTTPPRITNLKATLEGGKVHVTADAADSISPIAHAEYSVDAGPWQYIDPVGKLSDSLEEHYDFVAPLKTPGPGDAPAAKEHVVTVRVYDRHENVTAAKAVVH